MLRLATAGNVGSLGNLQPDGGTSMGWHGTLRCCVPTAFRQGSFSHWSQVCVCVCVSASCINGTAHRRVIQEGSAARQIREADLGTSLGESVTRLQAASVGTAKLQCTPAGAERDRKQKGREGREKGSTSAEAA